MLNRPDMDVVRSLSEMGSTNRRNIMAWLEASENNILDSLLSSKELQDMGEFKGALKVCREIRRAMTGAPDTLNRMIRGETPADNGSEASPPNAF
jgi:hypothetical protein